MFSLLAQPLESDADKAERAQREVERKAEQERGRHKNVTNHPG